MGLALSNAKTKALNLSTHNLATTLSEARYTQKVIKVNTIIKANKIIKANTVIKVNKIIKDSRIIQAQGLDSLTLSKIDLRAKVLGQYSILSR
jgi:NDP-sugar pyrophosphorylase family protein